MTKAEKSAFYIALAKLEKKETSGKKGYRFLEHPSGLFKLAQNPSLEVALVTDSRKNSTWIASVKAYKQREEQNKLLAKLHKEENFFGDMENYNSSLKEITVAKEEGVIKGEYLF